MEYLIAYVKDHMISRKGVAMYLVLFVTGFLLILASQIVGRGEDAAAERQRTQEEENRHAELAGIITDAQSIRLESENLLARLKTVGEEDPSILEQLLDYEIQFTSVDARIKELVSQLPREVATEQRRHEGVAQAQLEAQARAAELSVLMRPKVEEAFALIRATIAKAALQGLVRVQSVTDPALPKPVMMSAYQSRGRSRALEDSGLVISFTKDWQWHVYLEPGLKRPRFSWTRMKGESNVQGGGGNGSIEGRGTGRGIGADGGSPKGDWSPCRRGGGRGGLPGAGAAVERQPEARRGAAAAAWRIAGGAVP